MKRFVSFCMVVVLLMTCWTPVQSAENLASMTDVVSVSNIPEDSDPVEKSTTVSTQEPTAAPTEAPTEEPTTAPTEAPTEEPAAAPTEVPTEEPTTAPTEAPTEETTSEPTEAPTEEPTAAPTEAPTEEPTTAPTEAPTEEPTEAPTEEPTEAPTEEPTTAPTESPTEEPVASATDVPVNTPTPEVSASATDLMAVTDVEEPVQLDPVYVNIVASIIYANKEFEVSWEYVEHGEGFVIRILQNDVELWRTTASADTTSCTVPATIITKAGTFQVSVEAHAEGYISSEETISFQTTDVGLIDGDLTYEVVGGSVTITGYLGSDTSITIPAQIDGMNVTSIGEKAFQDCGVEIVKLPDTIKTIEDKAFYRCALQEINLPEGLESIGSSAFVYAEFESLSLPSTLKKIGDGAFYCVPIETLTIPAGVTSIGEQAFQECQLTTVYLPSTLKKISDGMFLECYDLEKVVIAEGTTAIGQQAFCCAGIKSISIPDSITTIEYGAFMESGLTSIALPENVGSVGESAFFGCTGLKKVVVHNASASFGAEAFAGCAEDLVIYGYTGSTAESYAAANSISFVSLDNTDKAPELACESNVTLAGGSLDFTVSAAGAALLRVSVNGGEAVEFAPTGSETVYTHTFPEAGEYTLVFAAKVDGAWTKDTEPVQVYVYADTQLPAPVLSNVPRTVKAGEQFTFSWTVTAEPNWATDYHIVIRRDEADDQSVVCEYNYFDGNVSGTEDTIYANFQPGAYVLSVIAVADEFFTESEPAEASFTMEPGDSDFLYEVDEAQGIAWITGYIGTAKDVSIPAELDGYPVSFMDNNAMVGLNITSVTFPEGLQSIESSAFVNCSNLAKAVIPKNTQVSASAFVNCPNLVIYGYYDSSAEKAAQEAGLPFVVVNAPTTLSFTMDKSSVLPGETVTFTITAPLAEELALSCNGTEMCCFYADDARTDRYTWVVATTFEPGSTWNIAFAYRVDADSEWSEPCQAQQLTVGDAIRLEPIVVTTESGLYMGEDAVFSWNAVEHTAYYSVSLNHDSWGWNVPLDSSTATSVTIPGERLAEVGEYTLSVRAHTTDEAGYFCCQGIYLGSQYSCSDGALTFQVTNERTCNGFRYVLDEDGHAQIVGYDGDLTGVHLEIPESLDGTTVAGIASGAFPAELTRVTVPGTVTEIAPDAFAGDESLRIYGCIDSAAHMYATEQGYVFIPTDGILLTADKAEVVTGDTVTIMMRGQYLHLYDLYDEDWIFSRITGVKDGEATVSIRFGESGTYSLCAKQSHDSDPNSNILTITVAEGPFIIEIINEPVAGEYAEFFFTEIPNADSYTGIVNYYLRGVHDEYGDIVTYWGLFLGNDYSRASLKSVCRGEYTFVLEAWYEDKMIASTTTRATVHPETGLPFKYTFLSDSEVQIDAYFGYEPDVMIPKQIEGCDVVSFGDYSFSRIWLESVDIPDTVRDIGENAFEETKLKYVELPEGIKSIETYTFFNCANLERIQLPDSVKSIGKNAYNGCALQSLDIPESVTSIGENAFQGNQIDKIIIPDSIQIIESGTFYNNGATEVSIPSSVQSIKDFAFGMNALTEVEIPSSVSEIGYRSFAHNDDLADVYVYNSDAVFGDDVFMFATPTLHGYTGSSTQAYAEQYGLNFVPLDGEPEDPDPTVKPDETEEPEITPTPAPQEAIAFTLTPDTITVGESVTFVITVPGAEQLKFIADAGTDSAYEETIPADGDVTTYTRTFTKAGARSIQFSALVDGAWTDPAPAQTVTVNSLGQLGKPIVTVQEPVYLGEGFTASWTAVEHAQRYVLHLTLEGVETWTATTAETSAAIPGSAVTEEGTYILLVQPIADGYSQNEGSCAFGVGDSYITIEKAFVIGDVGTKRSYWVQGTASDDVKVVAMTVLINGQEDGSISGSVYYTRNNQYVLHSLNSGIDNVTDLSIYKLIVKGYDNLNDAQRDENMLCQTSYTYKNTDIESYGAKIVGLKCYEQDVLDRRHYLFEGEAIYYLYTEGMTEQVNLYKDGSYHGPHFDLWLENGMYLYEKPVQLTEGIHTLLFSLREDSARAETTVAVIRDVEDRSAYVAFEGTGLKEWPDDSAESVCIVPVYAEIVVKGEIGDYAFVQYGDSEYFVEKSLLTSKLPEKIDATTFENIADGDILTAGAPVASWTAVEGAEHYLVSLRDLTEDHALVQKQNEGDSTSFTLGMLTAGHSYRLWVASVPAGASYEQNPDLCGTAQVEFTWRTVPAFTVNGIETGVPGDSMTVSWTAPVWPGEDIQPDYYVVWWYGPGMEDGYAMQTAGDATSCTLPGEKTAQAGEYTAAVYACMYDSWGEGVHAYAEGKATMETPYVNITNAWLSDSYGMKWHNVTYTYGGGVEYLAIDVVCDGEIVFSTVWEAKNGSMSNSLVNWIGKLDKYSVVVRGYRSKEDAEQGVHMLCEDTSITHGSMDITGLYRNGTDANNKLRYAFEGAISYELKAVGMLENIDIYMDDEWQTRAVYKSGENGTHSFEARIKMEEGIHRLYFVTQDGSSSASTTFAAIRDVEDVTMYAGAAGAELKAWPAEYYAVQKALEPDAEMLLRGMIGDYAYVQVDGKNYFVRYDTLVDSPVPKTGWIFQLIDGGLGVNVRSASAHMSLYTYMLVVAQGEDEPVLSSVEAYDKTSQLIPYSPSQLYYQKRFMFEDDLQLEPGKTYHFAVVRKGTDLSAVTKFDFTYRYEVEGKVVEPLDGAVIDLWKGEPLSLRWGLYGACTDYFIRIYRLTEDGETELAFKIMYPVGAQEKATGIGEFVVEKEDLAEAFTEEEMMQANQLIICIEAHQ